METKAHHVLVGAFTLIVAICGMIFALWISRAALDREWQHYDVVFGEAVTGLTRGGAVQFNGIDVGSVQRLSIDPDNPAQVIVRVRIDAGTPVRVDTAAKLGFTGLTGISQIQLSGGSPDQPLLKDTLAPDAVPRIVAQQSDFSRLLDASEVIVVGAGEALARLSLLLSDQTIADFAKTIANLEQVSDTLATERAQIGDLLRDAAASAARLERVLRSAEGAMTGLDRDLPGLLQKLEQSLSEFEALARNTNSLVVDNRAALQQFSQDGLTQTGPALAELRGLLRQLTRLAAKIEENPAQGLLGGPVPEEYSP